MKINVLLLSVFFIVCISCQTNKTKTSDNSAEKPFHTHTLLDTGAEPWAIFKNGKYYYTQGAENKIVLWETTDITRLRDATFRHIWIPDKEEYSYHLWGPEIHYINDKWYIYFAADDGNMDNHQIYVIENSNENPLEGEWIMKGRISTDKDNNWAIHASTFEHAGKRYMIWCGWEKQRINEETQCIYIARMENPWTLGSERILISRPEYEWERQWISPDGSKTAYPIYVNEAPQLFYSENQDKVLIYYSASGSWTPYYCVGMLLADSDSDLLNADSWKKDPAPKLIQDIDRKIYGPGSLCFIPSSDEKQWYVLYHAREIPNDAPGATDSRTPRLLKMEWGEDGLPVLDLSYTESISP